MDYYSKFEEALRKDSIDDCRLGISRVSEAIEKEAKLYLLRAKLSLKLVKYNTYASCIYHLYPYSWLSLSFQLMSMNASKIA